MKRIWFCLAWASPLGVLWACTGDEDVIATADAGADTGVIDGQTPSNDDGGVPRDAEAKDASRPARALIVKSAATGSELAIVNLETNAVDGRLPFEGSYGLTSSLGADPYLLDEENDEVLRLDPREPWKVVAKWDVHGDDGADAGDPNANPVAVVPTSPTKAYVLRYNRDRIAILDPSKNGAAPTGYIDLAALKQPGDPNMIEMTAAAYLPAKKRVYVLLGNADFTRTVTTGSFTYLLCAPQLRPSIIAIDVETDKVVSLGGTAPGGGIALEGYNPLLGAPLAYDAAHDRLIVLSAGCNDALDDGGVGPTVRRRVEQVDLATGEVTTLLSLDAHGFPSSLAFASGEHAALAFFFDGYHWDPRQPALGAAIEGGMDVIANDGRGAFVGTRQLYYPDGGGPLQVVAVPVGDAGPAIVTENPFTKAGGYISGIEALPRR